jgi:hypothetical protein
MPLDHNEREKRQMHLGHVNIQVRNVEVSYEQPRLDRQRQERLFAPDITNLVVFRVPGTTTRRTIARPASCNGLPQFWRRGRWRRGR